MSVICSSKLHPTSSPYTQIYHNEVHHLIQNGVLMSAVKIPVVIQVCQQDVYINFLQNGIVLVVSYFVVTILLFSFHQTLQYIKYKRKV